MTHGFISWLWPVDGRESIFMLSFPVLILEMTGIIHIYIFISPAKNNDNKSWGGSRLSIITEWTASEEFVSEGPESPEQPSKEEKDDSERWVCGAYTDEHESWISDSR